MDFVILAGMIRKGLKMNQDHIVLFTLIIGGIPGFLFGYMKGHEDGLKQARQSYRRLTRQMEQHKVNR